MQSLPSRQPEPRIANETIRRPPFSPSAIVVIGASLGGVEALRVILSELPADFPLPIAIAQRRAAESDGGRMVDALQRHCALPVSEPEDKEAILGGRVYLAPADYHLLVERGHFALSLDEPVLFARPAVDALFESAADAYGAGVIGVVLTGASQDGAAGAAAIKAQGGKIIVQDPDTAESPVMPRSAREMADEVMRVEEVAKRIIRNPK